MRAEMTARIAFREGIIGTWSSSPDRPAAIEATARSHAGGAWFDIGVCRSMLGDATAARQAFARAAEMMSSALEVTSPPPLATYTSALESAVLSGEETLVARLAASPVAPEPRPALIGDRLAWALAIPALVRGDDATAMTHALAASVVPEKKAWYPGLGSAIRALISTDTTGLTASLERVLEKHAAYARARKSWCYNAAPCLLCVPAATLLRLGTSRGLRPQRIAGRRSRIPLALIHSAPESGQTIEIEADFVPESLTAP